MTAYHIIDIEKTDATGQEIEMLTLVLCAEYKPDTIITDAEGSMYSLYSESQHRGINSFAKGALAAIQLREALAEMENE